MSTYEAGASKVTGNVGVRPARPNAGLPVAISVGSAAAEVLLGTRAGSQTFLSIKIPSSPVLAAATPAVAESCTKKTIQTPGLPWLADPVQKMP